MRHPTFLQHVPGFKLAHTLLNKLRFTGRPLRQLDIGPWNTRLPGFERLDVAADQYLPHYFATASHIPFADNTFDIVHASHILEHIPWYQSQDVLREWTRVLKPGGRLEISVPDGEFICRAFLSGEADNPSLIASDGYYKFNPDKDPNLWASYRLYAYGDGAGSLNHPNWHRALFTKRLLSKLMSNAGLTGIREITPDALRIKDHLSINLGLVGTKE